MLIGIREMCDLNLRTCRSFDMAPYAVHITTDPHLQRARAWYHVIIEQVAASQRDPAQARAGGSKDESVALSIADHQILLLGGVYLAEPLCHLADCPPAIHVRHRY